MTIRCQLCPDLPIEDEAARVCHQAVLVSHFSPDILHAPCGAAGCQIQPLTYLSWQCRFYRFDFLGSMLFLRFWLAVPDLTFGIDVDVPDLCQVPASPGCDLYGTSLRILPSICGISYQGRLPLFGKVPICHSPPSGNTNPVVWSGEDSWLASKYRMPAVD